MASAVNEVSAAGERLQDGIGRGGRSWKRGFLVDGFIVHRICAAENREKSRAADFRGRGQQSVQRESLVSRPGASSWNRTQSGWKQETEGKERRALVIVGLPG